MTQYAILEVKGFENDITYASIGIPKNAHLFGAKKDEHAEVEIQRVNKDDGEFLTETVDASIVEVLGYTEGRLGSKPTMSPDEAAKGYIKYVTGQ